MEKNEIIYERKLDGSYMKVEVDGEDGFDEKMLMCRQIPGLLPIEKCYLNGRRQFWYNISGKQSLDTFCRVKPIGQAFLEQLVHGICDELGILDQHLVDTNCLGLEPEFVYISIQTGEFFFTAIPGRGVCVADGFRDLMEYLLTRVDHTDGKAVQLAYDIYEKTLDEGYSIADIQASIVHAHIAETDGFSKSLPVEPEKGSATHPVEISTPSNEKKVENIPKKVRWTDRFLAWAAGFFKNRKEKRNRSGKREENGCKTNNRAMQGAEKTQKRRQKQELPEFFYREQHKEPEREKSGWERGDAGGKEWRIVYPDEEEEEEIHEQIHPTVCLSGYRESPEGVLVYEGHENFFNIRLENRSLQIGYSADSDIIIAKDTISRYHARIEVENKAYFLEDLNSTNGTFVNDKQLVYKEKRKLEPNDIVRFADVKYRFV